MKCSSVRHALVHHHALIANLICLIAFIVQFGNILHGYISPEQTNIRVSEQNMATFPLVFKICFSPGINESAIEEAGYAGIWEYFNGLSKYNMSIVGWGGHTNTSGVRGEVKELMEKVQLHTVREVIDGIRVYSMKNDLFWISLASVSLWRINYPFNCFTLDLTNNTEVKEKGIRKIRIQFPMIQNTSVSILPQGKDWACNREINSNQFFSSGANVNLENLGEMKYLICLFLRLNHLNC